MDIVDGKKKEKLQETYLGLPVLNEAIVVEVDSEGYITGWGHHGHVSLVTGSGYLSSV